MTDKITKFINSLDKKTKEKLKTKLKEIKANPFHVKNVKKLQGMGDNTYRLRIGKIRVIYRVSAELEIIDIDYRGNIY